MTNTKILKVLDIYETRLTLPGLNYSDDIVHCLGMIPKMREFVAEGRIEKTFRWLGFIQGVFWASRLYSIEEMKNHNKPDADE